MKSRITLKDVAREAGVNFTLVSKYLTANPQARMTDETRERIKRAIQKLDYRPSAAARALRYGRSKAIGLVVGDLTNAYYAHIANLALKELRPRDYQLLIALESPDYDPVQSLLSREVDGIIYAGAGKPPSGMQIPVAVNDRHIAGACEINLDISGALADAMENLKGKTLGLFFEHSLWIKAFEACAKRLGVNADVEILPTPPDKRFAMLERIAKTKPDAVFASGWLTLRAMRKIGGFGKIFAHANCAGSFLNGENVAGAIFSSTTELIEKTCRAIVGQIESGERVSEKIHTRYVSAESEEFGGLASGDFRLT